MKKNIVRKGLVVGTIILLVGVTIASGISFKVNISKTIEVKTSNSELVKFPICICRPDGIEDYEVFITQQQVEDLDNLIDDFKQKLKDIETLEETSILFNDTISSMYEIGVIPNDISIEEAQQLVTGDLYNLNTETTKEMKNTQFANAGILNDCCFIFSNATNVGFWGRFYFGWYRIDPQYIFYYHFARGLMWTNGLLGIQTMEGRFRGNMGEEICLPSDSFGINSGYAGTIGLVGFHMPSRDLLFGFAISANFVYV